MTKKHFKALADALANNRPASVTDTEQTVAEYQSALEQWRNDVRTIADTCRLFNSNFDRGAFLRACNFAAD